MEFTRYNAEKKMCNLTIDGSEVKVKDHHKNFVINLNFKNSATAIKHLQARNLTTVYVDNKEILNKFIGKKLKLSLSSLKQYLKKKLLTYYLILSNLLKCKMDAISSGVQKASEFNLQK